MDFELSEDQQQILKSVKDLLGQHAGPTRNIELQPTAAYDTELHEALEENGYTEIARMDEMGPLEAALIAEEVAYAAGVVAFAESALVATGVSDEEIEGPISLATVADSGKPIRYACTAKTLLILDGDEARVLSLKDGDIEKVESNFGYPMGRYKGELKGAGKSLGAGSGDKLRNWWRVALAVETVGCMRAALWHVVGYLSERRQFGVAIGSFQAVQHKLADNAVTIHGARWLALEAAFKGAQKDQAAVAAAFALETAGTAFTDFHQLAGAIGFTREHNLHVWTMRLMALRVELGGVHSHRRAIAEARWEVQ